MRSVLKRTAEKALARLGMGTVSRTLNRGRTVVLAYHNVVPHGETRCGDRSLHLRQETFGRQLDRLLDTHDVVPLSSLASPVEARKSVASGPQAAITFDDAYRGALTAGLEELGRRDIPATIFAAPAMLEEEAFWWDLLAAGADGGVDEAVRDHALNALAGRQAAILRWARGEGLPRHRDLPDHARPATPDLLRSVSRAPSVTLASHTWSHANLAALSPDDVARELADAVDWFGAHDLPFRRWLAYPYGLHSSAVREQARQSHSLAFTTEARLTAGSADSMPDRMQVPRMNIPAGASLVRFQLLASGTFDLFRRRRAPH